MQTSSIERVTPEIATEWLQHNVENRPPRKAWVKELARRMLSGSWMAPFGDAAIIFDSNGHLRNGQHRLMAVAESGATIEMHVVRGAPSDCFLVVDSGRSRNPADVVAINGWPNAKLAAAAARMVHTHSSGNAWWTRGAPFDGREAERAMRDHPRLVDHVSAHGCHRAFATMRIPPSFVVFFSYTARPQDKAQEFISGLESGEGLPAGDPRLALRERLIRAHGSGGTRAKLSEQMVIALYLHAWRAFKGGKKLRTLNKIFDLVPATFALD